jgi:hypothetical protein
VTEVGPNEKEFSLWGEVVALGVGLLFVYLFTGLFTVLLAMWAMGGLRIFDMAPISSCRKLLFDHSFVFSCFPGMAGGCVAGHVFRRRASEFVWLVFAVILLYKILTFSHSVLDASTGTGGWHYYFGGGFALPDFETWDDFWELVRTPESNRGIEQLHCTGRFYASLGYSAMAFVYRRFIARL